MKHALRFLMVSTVLLFALYATDDVVTAIHGTVTKVDAVSKTMVVKTKDGAEHTVYYTEKTTVWAGETAASGAKASAKDIAEGSEVVVHYTEKGTKASATEIDKIGKDGLKSIDGTVTKVSKDGKIVVVKTADGTEQTFQVAGKDTAKAAEAAGKSTTKASKATVYYVQEGGKKIIHFFE